jgi:C1A family cysteine protease
VKRVLNWKPSRPDPRDFRFKLRRPIKLPAKADVIRKNLPPVLDQGSLGSCVGHGIAETAHVNLVATGKKPFLTSRLAIYYEARAIEGTVREDAGCYIRDAMKAMAKTGCGREPTWPYVIAKFTRKPPPKYYASAKRTKVTRYERVQHKLRNIKEALARGYPVVFGFEVPESFMSDAVASTGKMPMPKRGEAIQGGHCVIAIGYDDTHQAVRCRNSWGKSWGFEGDFWMPYKFIANPKWCDDFWCFWN